MAEKQTPGRPAAAAETPAAEKPKGRLPLKALAVVVVAFALQIAVVLLVFRLARPVPLSAAAAGTGEGGAESAPAVLYQTVELGTFNLTQFEQGAPTSRRQLAVTLAVSVNRDRAHETTPRVVAQKAWIGQTLDEQLGLLPLDALHAANRADLKRQLKEQINKRIGEDVVQEVILRIQFFGP